MSPSARVIVLASAFMRTVSIKRTMSAVEMRRRSGSSFEMVSFLMRIGRMRAAIPMSSRILTMLLPMTLPRSISVVPFTREEMETASSGAPVPKATIVRPTSILLTLKWEATEEEASISQSAPLMRMMKPTRSNEICKTMSIDVIIVRF